MKIYNDENFYSYINIHTPICPQISPNALLADDYV